MVPLHIPPGRAGRLWLRDRLAVADRAADVLDEKRRILLREAWRLRTIAADARGRWEDASRTAGTWQLRAALLGGEQQLDIAAAYVPATAEAHVSWASTMGLSYPRSAECVLPDPVNLADVSGTVAIVDAAEAHRAALVAAAEYAAAQRAADIVAAELGMTTRRLRAIQRRWIPRLEEALHELERRLDERERDDALRARWALERLAAAGR